MLGIWNNHDYPMLDYPVYAVLSGVGCITRCMLYMKTQLFSITDG